MDRKIMIAVIAILAIVAVGVTAYMLTSDDNDVEVVTYDANGGRLGDKTVWTEMGEVIPAYDVVRDGYRFAGWNTAADGSGKAYDAGDTVDMGTKLYAVWGQPAIVFDTGYAHEFDFYYGSSDEGSDAPVKIDNEKEYAIHSNPMVLIVPKTAADKTVIEGKTIKFTFEDTQVELGFMESTYTVGSIENGDEGVYVHFTATAPFVNFCVSHKSFKD